MKELCLDTSCFNLCFWISTFVVPTLTYFSIRLLRPRLKINKSQINKDELKIEILNKSKVFDVNNLRIEICVFNSKERTTYHFDPDHFDFLILPCSGILNQKDNSKTFVSRRASESALILLRQNNPIITPELGFSHLIEMLNDSSKIRVRCHAYNSFSGLGKSFEEIF